MALEPSIHSVGASPAQNERLNDAVRRFTSLGLPLPDLLVRFEDDDGACGGHLGLFRRRTQPWTIVICADLWFVYEHELAHAWEAANLKDEHRSRYLGLRGLSEWSDHAVPRSERGVEDVAFIVQQGLLPSPVHRPTDEACRRLHAFRFLTGVDAPRGALVSSACELVASAGIRKVS